MQTMTRLQEKMQRQQIPKRDRPQMRLVKSRQPLVKQRKRNRILQMTVQTARKLTVMQMHRIPIQKIHQEGQE